jgi:dihydroxyacetone kinase-like predicted kinase
VPSLTRKRVTVVPTRDVLGGFAVQLALSGHDAVPDPDVLQSALDAVATAAVFFAAKPSTVDGVIVEAGAPAAKIRGRLLTAPSLSAVILAAAAELGAADGGLVTLYYGGKQKERDAQRAAAEIGERFADVNVEYYFGGAPAIEYWISCE